MVLLNQTRVVDGPEFTLATLYDYVLMEPVVSIRFFCVLDSKRPTHVARRLQVQQGIWFNMRH